MNIVSLFISIIIAQMAGVIGSIFTSSSIKSWYVDLVRPELAPPNWVFGPVWTTLFALMGISAWLVWREYRKWSLGKNKQIKIALGIYVVQLVLNTLWSILFFGLHSPGLAFIEIIILWFAILSTIISFARISRLAAWLLVPYICWVSFAAYLNFMFWILN